ncbi:hypothetical protein RYX45_20880, partial [Alkalihalophilus pseudofirmus]
MIPLILNQSECIGALQREKMIDDKYVILEKLKDELQGIDNSVYVEVSLFHYSEYEIEDGIYHFIFKNVPHEQNKIVGNEANAI